MCITVKKKFKNVEKWKFKLASKFLKKVENPEKIPKTTFLKMVDFWHFFAICILYLYFVFCPKCICDQIQFTKPVSKHNFNPILCRWWWWRFGWSDATRLSEFNRSEGQADPMANLEQTKLKKDKKTKIRKDKNTKYKTQNANTKYRLQKNVKNLPS